MKLPQEFFSQQLLAQRAASPRTIASYRDAIRLLLQFTEKRLRKAPTDLAMEDLDSTLVLEFLDHLEKERGNSARSRNLRLTTVRSFMKFSALRDPSSLAVAQRVLAIPTKRFDRRMVGFLSRREVDSILDAPDGSTWSGRRDRVLFATLYNTGARVSEIIGVRRRDLILEGVACVRLLGKGRKERAVPLRRTTARDLRRWLDQIEGGEERPVFPNRGGQALSRSGVEDRLDAAVRLAEATCISLRGRQISPHTFRHSTAMHLLQAGVDVTVIALWLGHENPATTHLYVEADLAMKERALAKVQPTRSGIGRFRPGDGLLAFLEAL